MLLYTPSYALKPPVGAQIGWGHPLARELRFALPLNEGTGRPRDLVFGLSGAPNGTAWWRSTAVGIATTYDGSGDFFTWTDHPFQTPKREFTLAVQVRRNRSGVREIFLGKGDGAGVTTGSYWLEFNSLDQVVFTLEDDNHRVLVATDLVVADGNWHQIVAVSDGVTMRAYKDGIRSTVFADTGIGDLNVTSNPLSLGRLGNFTGGLELQGDIGFFYLWHRAFIPAEVQWLALEPFAPLLVSEGPWISTAGAAYEQILTEALALADTTSRTAIRALTETLALMDVSTHNKIVVLLETIAPADLTARAITRIIQEALGLTATAVGDTMQPIEILLREAGTKTYDLQASLATYDLLAEGQEEV